jgi:hypothetical protein
MPDPPDSSGVALNGIGSVCESHSRVGPRRRSRQRRSTTSCAAQKGFRLSCVTSLALSVRPAGFKPDVHARFPRLRAPRPHRGAPTRCFPKRRRSVTTCPPPRWSSGSSVTPRLSAPVAPETDPKAATSDPAPAAEATEIVRRTTVATAAEGGSTITRRRPSPRHSAIGARPLAAV